MPRPLPRRTIVKGLTAAAGSMLSSNVFGADQIVRSKGAALRIQISADDFDLPQKTILDWVQRCADAVSTWLGEFPVSSATIRFIPSNRDGGVLHGTSWGGEQAETRISMGRHATEADLARDWVLTHELFHFAFPSVPDQHLWIEEGISTYAEPFARAGVGLLSPEQVWSDMMRDMPKGLPQAGDQGLDRTHTWGRTYWGGALFCLRADIGIRQATAGRRDLAIALKGINAAGGNITAEWPLTRALEIGDRATGTRVLSDLYQQMGMSPVSVDLPALWKQLGVERSVDGVTFDDRAPLAELRPNVIKISSLKK